MSEIVKRIRSRLNDAPMPTEHLLDDAADHIERLERAIHDICWPAGALLQDTKAAIERARELVPFDNGATPPPSPQ